MDHSLSSEEDGSKSSDKCEAADDSIAIADPFRQPTIDEQADDLTNNYSLMTCQSKITKYKWSTDIAQTSLPSSWDLPSTIWQLLSVFAIELVEGD